MNYDTKLIIQPSVLTSMSPMFLTQKLQFCNFHAVFGYCVQIPPPTSHPYLGNPELLDWKMELKQQNPTYTFETSDPMFGFM